jgi:type II secretory pathway pseudopilin PulG
MNKKRGFTLIELVVAIILIMVVLGALTSVIVFYDRIQRKVAASPAATMALTLETGVQSIFRAVNISDISVVLIGDGGQTLVWQTQGGSQKRLKFNPADGRIYYDAKYDDSKANTFSGEPLLAHVSATNFSQEPASGRVFLEVETRYDPQRGKVGAQKVTGMRTAVRSFLVKGLGVGPKSARLQCSPAIEGVIVTSKKEGDSLFAVVEADSVAIHTPAGFTKTIGKEMVYVQVPLSMPIQDYFGKRVMFNGDVLPRKDGRYMAMNLLYGGGLISDAPKIATMHKNIQDGLEPWYNEQTENLRGCFAMAKEKGVDFNDWKKVWDWMIYYYGEYIVNLEQKGTVKIKTLIPE